MSQSKADMSQFRTSVAIEVPLWPLVAPEVPLKCPFWSLQCPARPPKCPPKAPRGPAGYYNVSPCALGFALPVSGSISGLPVSGSVSGP